MIPDGSSRVSAVGVDPTLTVRHGRPRACSRSATARLRSRSSDAQREAALKSRDEFQQALIAAGYGQITTEIEPAPEFYYAEHYHQQYLAKVPNGYCGLGGTGVTCDIAPLAELKNA